jgi:hypothetical protein
MEERRKDDHKIAILEERVSNWMLTTTEYRKALCAKLDVVLDNQHKMNSRLDKLPCEARKQIYGHIWANVYALWAVVGILFSALLLKIIGGI